MTGDKSIEEGVVHPVFGRKGTLLRSSGEEVGRGTRTEGQKRQQGHTNGITTE